MVSFGLSPNYDTLRPASEEVVNFVKGAFGNRVSVKDEQRNRDNPNIVKTTFNLYSSRGVEKLQVVFDLQANKIMGQTFLNQGFFPAKANDETVQAVGEFLRDKLQRYSLGDQVKLLKAEKRTADGKGEVKVYYEFENETVFARVAFDEDNFTILHLESLPSDLQELREANLRESEEDRVAIRKEPEFQELEALLLDLYRQYLDGAELLGAETN